MKKIILRSAAAIGLMGLAYYLYNPKRYNRMAQQARHTISAGLKKA